MAIDVDELSDNIVHRLFSASADYPPMQQGLQEVPVNTEELVATAIVKGFAGCASENLFFSNLWVDDMALLAGFVLKGVGIVD